LREHEVAFVGRGQGLYFVRKLTDLVYDLEIGPWYLLFEEKAELKGLLPFEPDRVIAFFRGEKTTILENLKRSFPGARVFLFPSLPDTSGEISHIVRYLVWTMGQAGVEVGMGSIRQIVDKGIYGPIPVAGAHMTYHVGSGSSQKNYDLDFWLKIVEIGSRVFPQKRPLFLFGPAEEGLFRGNKSTLILRGIHPTYCTSPEGLFGILRDTWCYLGHDSGPTHLSALMGIPTVAFFKASSLKAWRPMGRAVKVFSRPTRRLWEGGLERVLLEITKRDLCCH
jgi:hypothetical protein